MKTNRLSIILAMVVGSVWLAVCTPIAFAQTNIIGVNFTSNGNDQNAHGAADLEADALLPTDLAGVYPQTNWNNLGRYGSQSAMVLTNSAGGTQTFIANWDAGGADTTGSGAGLGTPDGKLMDGFSYSWGPGAASPLASSIYGSAINNKPIFWLSGLQSFYTNQNAECYNIVLYTVGYTYYETSEGYIESVSGNPIDNTMVEGTSLTPHVFAGDSSPYVGTYVQATGATSGSATYGANYMIFTGLTNDAVLIRLQSSGYGAGLNGFQIVPQFPSAPTAVTPTFSPASEVYAEVPVTITEAAQGDPITTNLYYQWYSDNASGGAVTNLILNATNATLDVVPTNNTSTYYVQYQVVVTNIYGAATSAVATLTVDPAVAPFVTTDTTPGPGSGLTGVYAYVGDSVTFSATFGGTPPTYLWESNSVSIPGATDTNLTLANVQVATSANYDLTATNSVGGSSSTPVALTVLPAPAAPNPATQAYYQLAYTNNAWAYWRLNETLDPTVGTVSYKAYDYTGHGFSATYGNAVTVNNPGPSSLTPGFPGFDNNELAAETFVATANSSLTVPPLNLSGQPNVTFMAWINPSGSQQPGTGLLFNRNGSDAAGFGYTSTIDELGYTWNTNDANTYGWHSGLEVADNNWNYVAYVITPTNATIYLGNLAGGTTNFQQSTHVYAHTSESWAGGTTLLGSDPSSTSRNFNGLISEFTLFTNALSTAQIQSYFLTAIGASGLAPTVGATTISPNVPLYSGQNVLLSANVSGTAPIGLQWQSSPDGSAWANVPGATSSSAVVNPFTVGTVYYQLVAANSLASVTNAPVSATFNALPTTPAGLWTVNFQMTNNVNLSLTFTASTNLGGAGPYAGRGLLGNGTYWNPIPNNSSSGTYEFYQSPLASVSDLADDGATHSGIYATVLNSSDYGSSVGSLPVGSLGCLLQQWAILGTGTNVVFTGVPDGTYNVALYDEDDYFDDRGEVYVAYGANGPQTNTTLNVANITSTTTQNAVLALNDNCTLFTNVQVVGGTLDIGTFPNSAAHGGGNTEIDFNGAQLQLVSYIVPTPTVTLGGQFVPANGSTEGTMTLSWPQGILQTATNLLGPWTPIYAPSPVVMTTTNATQFFRVQVR